MGPVQNQVAKNAESWSEEKIDKGAKGWPVHPESGRPWNQTMAHTLRILKGRDTDRKPKCHGQKGQ